MIKVSPWFRTLSMIGCAAFCLGLVPGDNGLVYGSAWAKNGEGKAKLLAAKGLPDSFGVRFNRAERKQRVLHFPEYSLGEIVISDWPDDFDNVVRGAAKGTIVVPAGKFCTFVPAHRFFQNPAIIKTFPPDAFECVWLSALSLADEEDGLCDRALAQIGHLKGLLELNLDKSDATDTGLVYASELPNLQKITAFQATIRGACLAKFGGLKQLHYLRLPSSWMQDENLKNAAVIPNLTALSLGHAGVSDKGVKNLAGCTHLVSLDLADCPKVTDESIKTIAALKSLRFLSLDGTSITDKGMMQLKGNPYLSIRWPQKKAYSNEQMVAIRKQFPGAGVYFSVPRTKVLDSDTRALYAPLR